MVLDAALLDWLLDADPPLRWQVECDLAGAPQERWGATCARIATEGFGARLLALQDPDGQWAGGSYFPSDFDFHGPEAAEDAGQPWTATTWTLNTLRDWGLDAAALACTADLLAANSRWDYDDLPYWGGEVDADTLANGAWLGADVSGIAQWFLDHRLADGGWNCEWVEGSTRSSFHSTLNAVKGLLYYEAATGGGEALRAARRAGEEYLLGASAASHLVEGRTRRAVGDTIRIPVPLVLQRAARSGALPGGGTARRRRARSSAGGRDEVIRAARQRDGTWLQERRHPGRVWFEVDVPPGEPSRWLTFYGARVLAWWDGATRASLYPVTNVGPSPPRGRAGL